MKKWAYMLVLLLLAIIPVAGKSTQTCRTECSRRYNRCLQQAGRSVPRQEACKKDYNSCVYRCDNPPSMPGE